MAFCDCLNITLQIDDAPLQTINVVASGTFNGYNTYEWTYNGTTYFLWHNGIDNWYVTTSQIGDQSEIIEELKNNTEPCPIAEIPNWIGEFETFATQDGGCHDCVNIEDRHQKKYEAIKLPVIFDEQSRGWKGCCNCEPMLTLASTDPETWKNDVTSAWIKMGDPTNTVQFKLEKNGNPAIFTPSINDFVNEDNAFYTTIRWIDVLNSDGIGCYTLKVSYNISGVIGEFVWGVYNLKPYTIENALKTARIRVKFNLQQEIEGINFTASNIEDTIRFCGFIGERQPNMEIDNLIYQNRGMKTVVRENLNTYKITTDPTGECITTKLTDLYLLSENEMWVSDYNAHNHSYKYLDLPVIVKESPEIEYIDILQRKAIVVCEVSDRSKNKRTFY